MRRLLTVGICVLAAAGAAALVPAGRAGAAPVTRLSTGATTVDRYTVAALGAIRSHEYLSVGNKYPLPKPANNTDQFVGDMTRVVYCVGSPAHVLRCLSVYLPH